MENNRVYISECPRDAMQGLQTLIPTTDKIAYLNALLQCGFDVLDFGSFVSPKAIPQMADTEAVLSELQLEEIRTQLLVITANRQGMELAFKHQEKIRLIGFPLSLSETFQQKNTKRSIASALEDLHFLLETAQHHHQLPVVYLSMGFGNPYGDPYSAELVVQFIQHMLEWNLPFRLSLADTTGEALPENIRLLFEKAEAVLPESMRADLGLHLHASPKDAYSKIQAALASGCRRIDAALLGFGGCPFAKDDLVGNIDTLTLIQLIEDLHLTHSVNREALAKALTLAHPLFAAAS